MNCWSLNFPKATTPWTVTPRFYDPPRQRLIFESHPPLHPGRRKSSAEGRVPSISPPVPVRCSALQLRPVLALSHGRLFHDLGAGTTTPCVNHSLRLVAWFRQLIEDFALRVHPIPCVTFVGDTFLVGTPCDDEFRALYVKLVVYFQPKRVFAHALEQDMLPSGPDSYRRVIAAARLLIRTLGRFAQVHTSQE